MSVQKKTDCALKPNRQETQQLKSEIYQPKVPPSTITLSCLCELTLVL